MVELKHVHNLLTEALIILKYSSPIIIISLCSYPLWVLTGEGEGVANISNGYLGKGQGG